MSEKIIEEIEIRKEAVREYNTVKPVLDGQWNEMKDKLHNMWLEVSVVIDGNNRLFISKGTGSFVDYESENVSGMKIPLKCWIHTHPFGAAYFSHIDWNTINKQRFILNSAIVLGNMERMKWYKDWEGEELLCRTETVTMVELNKEKEVMREEE